MKKIVLLSTLLFSCGTPPGNEPKPVTTTPVPTATPTPFTTKNCELVPFHAFSANSLSEGWQTARWFDPKDNINPTEELFEFTPDGAHFKALQGNPRGSIMKFLNTDVSDCQDLGVHLTGKIISQSLQGTGRDDREAPIAVYVSYVDTKGVNHNTITAYNGGEADDRTTTRMFFKGFTTSKTDKPNEILVPANEEFSWYVELPKDVKVVNFIAVSGTSWGHESFVKDVEFFAMPKHEIPDIPVATPTTPQPVSSTDKLDDTSWSHAQPGPNYGQCYRDISFYGEYTKNYCYREYCGNVIGVYRCGVWTLSVSDMDLYVTETIPSGATYVDHSSDVHFMTNTVKNEMTMYFSNGMLCLKDKSNTFPDAITCFDKQ